MECSMVYGYMYEYGVTLGDWRKGHQTLGSLMLIFLWHFHCGVNALKQLLANPYTYYIVIIIKMGQTLNYPSGIHKA